MLSLKKVLHISNYLYPHIGGIEQVTRDCMNSLNGLYEQKVICFNNEKKTEIDFVDNIEVTRVGCFMKIASQSLSFCYKKEIKKIMKNYEPDVIIFHYPNPFVAHYLRKYLKKKDFKFILWWHLDITKQKVLRTFFRKQNKRLLSYADKIVATSPIYIKGSKYLTENKDKCVVIPCCVNEERLQYTKLHLEKAQEIKQKFKDKAICFAFGRHVEYKGLTYLVQASKLLNDDYVVLIGGQGPLTKKLKKKAEKDGKVFFLGELSNDELKEYLLACDVFCFPSITKNEAFGIGLAEAMYYEKASVTFNVEGSGVNYVSINNITGIEVKNGDVKAYCEAIKELASNKEKTKKYALEAKKRCHEKFLFSSFETSVKELLEEVGPK